MGARRNPPGTLLGDVPANGACGISAVTWFLCKLAHLATPFTAIFSRAEAICRRWEVSRADATYDEMLTCILPVIKSLRDMQTTALSQEEKYVIARELETYTDVGRLYHPNLNPEGTPQHCLPSCSRLLPSAPPSSVALKVFKPLHGHGSLFDLTVLPGQQGQPLACCVPP